MSISLRSKWHEIATDAPAANTLLYVWDATQAVLAVWNGENWQTARWDNKRWTTEGGRILHDITHWHESK